MTRNELIILVDDFTEPLSARDIHDADFAEKFADHLVANGVTVQKWIPVTERMPEERKSFVPGLGTVSKPVLVTWLDPTSDKQYPDNCFVREGITRNGEFTISHINGDLVPVAWMPQPKPFESPKGGNNPCRKMKERNGIRSTRASTTRT